VHGPHWATCPSWATFERKSTANCRAPIDWYRTLNDTGMPMNRGAVPRKSENDPDTKRVIAFFAASDTVNDSTTRRRCECGKAIYKSPAEAHRRDAAAAAVAEVAEAPRVFL